MEVSVSRTSSPARAVLLVDESIGTRAPLAHLLRAAGHRVLEAATSDDALDLLNSRLEIDALIAHERVQGAMDGLALADWVSRTRPRMRVLVLLDQEPHSDVSRGDIVFVSPSFPSAALLALLPSVKSSP
jgi:DNA-binding NtrC family response regulator